jgi:hypothetical protein
MIVEVGKRVTPEDDFEGYYPKRKDVMFTIE